MGGESVGLDKTATVLVMGALPETAARVQAALGAGASVTWVADWAHLQPFALSNPEPDLVLVDLANVQSDALDVCRRIKSSPLTQGMALVCLAAVVDETQEAQALAIGAVDYISPHCSPALMRTRLRNAMAAKAMGDGLRNHAAMLEEEVLRRTRETAVIQDATVLAMAALAETRDADTGNHLRRTQHYVRALARKLSTHPRFAALLTPRNIGMLFKSAPLHDIGKVGLPDRVLLKPGKLTDEEFEIMKTHTTLGRDAMAHAEEALGVAVDFFAFAKEIAYSHQEKWDGTGYPQGLAGEQIPVSARLMAVADVYDALISRRVYKPALSHVEAVRIITQIRGRHFDPDVVDAFLELQDTFEAIAIAFSDTDADLDKKAEYLQKAQI